MNQQYLSPVEAKKRSLPVLVKPECPVCSTWSELTLSLADLESVTCGNCGLALPRAAVIAGVVVQSIPPYMGCSQSDFVTYMEAITESLN